MKGFLNKPSAAGKLFEVRELTVDRR